FHTTVGRVRGFAFFIDDFYAVDAAIPRIDQLEVIHLAIRPRDAQRRKRPRAIGEQGYELFGCGSRHGNRTECARSGEHDRRHFELRFHLLSSVASTRRLCVSTPGWHAVSSSTWV